MRKQRTEQLKNNGKLGFRVLHEKFIDARESLDLTLDEMADELDVTPQYLRMIEKGERVGSVPFFFRLCHYLELDPSECVTMG